VICLRYESVPPKLYGGTERVVSYLTEELARLGHEVTLFASVDSQTQAKLVSACPRALWRGGGCRETLPHHVRLLELVFQDVSRFDVMHFHCDYLHLPLLRRYPCPSVTTLHGRLHTPDLQIKNYGLELVETSLLWHFKADYADIFEVGGRKRQARGQELPPEVTDDRVALGYRGLDGVVRRTLLHFTPPPSRLTASTAWLDLALGPQQEATFSMTVACQHGPKEAKESRIGAITTPELKK